MVNPELVESVYLAIGNELRYGNKYAWVSDRFDIDDLQQSAIVAAYEGGMFGEHMPIGEIARRAINRAIADTFPNDDFCCCLSTDEKIETDKRRDQMTSEVYPGKVRPRIVIGRNRRSSYAELVTCPIVDSALERLKSIQFESSVAYVGYAIEACKPSAIADIDDLRRRREEEFGFTDDDECGVYGVNILPEFGTPRSGWASYGVHFAFEHIADRSLYANSDWTDEEVERWEKGLDFDFCR